MEKLKELRKTKGKTQKQLSEFLGISQQAYATYELSTRTPPIDIIEKLADYFEVSIDYLLGRTDESENIKAPANNGEGLDKYIQVLEKAGITEEKLSRLTVEDINLIIAYAKGIIDSKRNSK